MSSSDRRATVFPGNANVSLPSKRPAEAESESSLRLSLSNIPKVPKFLQDQPRKRPAQLPVKVNPTSQRFSPTKSPNVAPRSRLSQPDKSSHVAQGTLYHRRNPWKEYYAILREEQAGNVTLAHKQELEHPIVVVKQQRCTNSTSVKGVAPCSHENVVSLLEIFYDEDVVFFIYECMDVSLAEIQSTRYGNLASYQIAAVCREVLDGILFIHTELKILHGSIDVDSVMVSKSGSIKIANIGQSMLAGVVSTHSSHQDIRALGLLMIQLMEIGTSLKDPQTLELQDPGRWDENIKIFLRNTAVLEGKELRKSVFLEQSPGGHCLKPLVLITEKSISREGEVCMH